jgi:hypothetical protein
MNVVFLRGKAALFLYMNNNTRLHKNEMVYVYSTSPYNQ